MKIVDIITESYTAYVLTKHARNKILSTFPPKFPEVRAHHITVKFDVPKNQRIPPHQAKIEVVGYASDDGLEAAVVSVNGKTARPDGKVYHITLSHNPDRKAVQSNNLLQNGWIAIKPFVIDGFPEILN